MIDIINGTINEIRPDINASLAQKSSELLTKATQADTRLQKLNGIKTAATNAKTVNEMNKPSLEYAELLQSQSLTTAKDIIEAQQEFDTLSSFASAFQQDANRRVQECQIFPSGTR
jgi:hypothetical protein